MAIPLSNNQQIWVKHRIMSADTAMPSMEMATDHYNIGYIISGDRTNITPKHKYTYHAGNVAMMAPYVYHKTMPASDAPYDNFLIKFSPEFIQPLIDVIGQNIFDSLYAQNVFRFSKKDQLLIEQMFYDMEAEYEKNTPYKELILQGMLFRLFTAIIEKSLPEENVTTHPSPLSKPIMDAVCLIELHYSERLTLENIANEVNLSCAYFSRLFTAQLGMSYSEYLNAVRLRHVQRLLSTTNKTIMDIALETGYCSGDYLSSQFKKKNGMTPKEFRNAAKTGY